MNLLKRPPCPKNKAEWNRLMTELFDDWTIAIPTIKEEDRPLPHENYSDWANANEHWVKDRSFNY